MIRTVLCNAALITILVHANAMEDNISVKAHTLVVVVVVFTLKTVLTSIQYPSLSYSSRQRNEFPWSHANPNKVQENKIK